MRRLKLNIAPIKPIIPFGDFKKVDVRVGTITRVEENQGSGNLVRLIVDFGDRTRRILAVIKQERSGPTEIQGRRALFVVNLEPRKMMGEFSEGMLLDIGYADGLTSVLVLPEKPIPDRVCEVGARYH